MDDLDLDYTIVAPKSKVPKVFKSAKSTYKGHVPKYRLNTKTDWLKIFSSLEIVDIGLVLKTFPHFFSQLSVLWKIAEKEAIPYIL